MASTRLYRSAITMLLGTFVIVLFTSYGNTKVHPSINEMIVQSFISKIKEAKPPEFKNYYFNFDLVNQCKGTAVTKSGLFQPEDINWINRKMENVAGMSAVALDVATLTATTTESDAEHSVTEWVSHGGYSADEPELPASLRHFYDPTAAEGKRYLTDKTNALILGTMQRVLKNPETDGVDWALGKPGDLSFNVQEHSYTWEKGKAWMKMALQEKNENKRSEYMGKAWRSLGETLHMIADNGCPPHVRNDAHPSPLCNYNIVFGNPDPYEEIVDIIRKSWPDDFLQYFKGKPDKQLMDQIKDMKKARDIAHALAVFTNANFVTGETISGTDKNGTVWQQITHPYDTYPSPLLQQMDYEEATGIFTTRINNYPDPVLQCCDKLYWNDLIPEICYSYVTFACVESQAKILLPNVVGAGRKVMELFIPKLKIEITSAENGHVKGRITHTTDQEYTSEIRYSGKVTLFFKDLNFKKKREQEAEVKNGQFDLSGLVFGSGDMVNARIDFGGIGVESPGFKCGSAALPEIKEKKQPDLKPCKEVTVSFNCYGHWNTTVDWNGVKWGGYLWYGPSFKMRIPVADGLHYKGRADWYNIEMDGEFNGNKIIRLHCKIVSIPEREAIENWDIIVENLPAESPGFYNAYAGSEVHPAGSPVKYIKKATCERSFPNGERQQLLNINWDESEGLNPMDLRSFVFIKMVDP